MPTTSKFTPTAPTRSSAPQRSLLAALALTAALTLFFLLIFFGLTAVSAARWGLSQATQFLSAAQITPLELAMTGWAGWTTTPEQTNGRTNILILGLDSLATRGEAPALTDTIILLSVDSGTGQIDALSFPRDLWLWEYQSRINALYYYGREQNPQQPYLLPQTAISDLTGVPIHHTVILTLDEVAQLIDAIGGVTVDVPAGFRDDQFPRPDVDVTTETDPAVLYQTVEFQPGVQTMSGSRALEYIRSRKSEGEAGGDDARVNRQQQVIAALLSQLTQPETLQQPQQAGQLYRFYQDNFARYLPMPEAIALAKQLWPVRNEVKFVGHSLSIYPEQTNGALVHPPESEYDGQWVYVVRDPDILAEEIKTSLNLPE